MNMESIATVYINKNLANIKQKQKKTNVLGLDKNDVGKR